MARLLLDFHCPKCGDIEKFVDSQSKSVECDCGTTAERRIGMPTVKLEGISGDFPDAHARWAKIREDNARIKARRNH